MNTLSKILKSILNATVKLTYAGDVGATLYNGTWTAPADGILVLKARVNNSGNVAYWYVSESGGTEVGAISTSRASQLLQTTTIPVRKGVGYTSPLKSGIQTATALYYRFDLVGGVLTRAKNFIQSLSRKVVTA